MALVDRTTLIITSKVPHDFGKKRSVTSSPSLAHKPTVGTWSTHPIVPRFVRMRLRDLRGIISNDPNTDHPIFLKCIVQVMCVKLLLEIEYIAEILNFIFTENTLV